MGPGGQHHDRGDVELVEAAGDGEVNRVDAVRSGYRDHKGVVVGPLRRPRYRTDDGEFAHFAVGGQALGPDCADEGLDMLLRRRLYATGEVQATGHHDVKLDRVP